MVSALTPGTRCRIRLKNSYLNGKLGSVADPPFADYPGAGRMVRVNIGPGILPFSAEALELNPTVEIDGRKLQIFTEDHALDGDLLVPIPKPKLRYSHGVQEYESHGSKYFRYWLDDSAAAGFRLRRLHIPGGNIRSAIARKRAQVVRDKIADGLEPARIMELIKSWRL